MRRTRGGGLLPVPDVRAPTRTRMGEGTFPLHCLGPHMAFKTPMEAPWGKPSQERTQPPGPRDENKRGQRAPGRCSDQA